MQFVVTAYDGAGMLDKRMEVRPRHLEGIATLGKKVIFAGGMLDDEGRLKGSVMVLEFDNRESFDDYLKNEPYVQAGVWEKITVEPVNVVISGGERV